MPAGAGGLKGVTTNSEHLLFRIIYIMWDFNNLSYYSRKWQNCIKLSDKLKKPFLEEAKKAHRKEKSKWTLQNLLLQAD